MRFVRTKGFDRDLKRLGATETDLEALLAELAVSPSAGDVIVGLRGLRKLRFGLRSRNIGKSGGGRAIYWLLMSDDTILLIMAFGKNEKPDLTPSDRKALLKFIAELENPDG